MEVEKIVMIVYFVLLSIAIAVSIITTIIQLKKKKSNGELVNADEAFEMIAGNVIEFVKNAEGAFASVKNGGALKLKDVLNDTKELCENAGISFNKGYWTEFIAKAVELINIDRKPKEVTEVKN